MQGDAEGFTLLQNPFKPGEIIRAKILRTKTAKEHWNEYELDDGTMVRIKMEVNVIAEPVDPTTGGPLQNPQTGEPVIHANWTVRIVTQFSDAAIKKYSRGKL
jgi:hypothetical protein